ncbi:MAG: alpha/beta hydrolase family protein [Rhodothermales bacterium]
MTRTPLWTCLIGLALLRTMAMDVAAQDADSASRQQTPASAWTSEFEAVEIPNPTNGTVQRAYFRRSTKEGPQPLVVVLHTWSGDYRQETESSLVPQAVEKDWHYIHPDFRGPNNTPDACCSDRAVEDIDAAIDYAVTHADVDTARVYVVGASGGGYATLCFFMKGRRMVASYGAWVPISDLEAWYEESRARESRYADDILQCTASGDALDVREARRRSPIHLPTPTEKLKRARLNLYAGVRDGVQGSVPITHSLLFYNKVLDDLGITADSAYATKDDLIHLLTAYTAPDSASGALGDRAILYRRAAGNVAVTIFEGGHEMLPDVALNLLEE